MRVCYVAINFYMGKTEGVGSQSRLVLSVGVSPCPGCCPVIPESGSLWVLSSAFPLFLLNAGKTRLVPQSVLVPESLSQRPEGGGHLGITLSREMAWHVKYPVLPLYQTMQLLGAPG